MIKNFCKSDTTNGHHTNRRIETVCCAQEEVVQENKRIKCEEEGFMFIQKKDTYTQACIQNLSIFSMITQNSSPQILHTVCVYPYNDYQNITS